MPDCPYCLKKWNKHIPLKYVGTGLTGSRNYICGRLCGNKFVKRKGETTLRMID